MRIFISPSPILRELHADGMVEGMDVISGQPEDGHLCDEDAQQHGQRVNIGVGEGWVVGAGELVGEGKRWWVCHAAGKDSDECGVVEPEPFPGNDADDEQGKRGHGGSKCHPLEAGCGECCFHEFPAGTEADAGEEEDDAELAEGGVCIEWHVDDERADFSHAAHENRNDERSTSQSQAQRNGEAGQCPWIKAEKNSQGDADENGGETCLVQLAD